jgi:hypothetical protein
MRTRICELHSLSWSYNRIYTKYPDIHKSIIGYMYRKEAKRVNNISQPRSGTPCIIIEEQRNILYDIATLVSSISYKALQAQVAPDTLIRLVKRLLQEMNLRKWQ